MRKSAEGVAQVSKPAVSPISKSARGRVTGPLKIVERFAGLETCDTADLEVCATLRFVAADVRRLMLFFGLAIS
jgi:hypothetical protein